MTRIETVFASVRGLRYRVRLAGAEDAAPVFLLHGLLDTGASFEPLMAHLEDGHRLIAPDWRGHGESDAARDGYWFPDYLADLETLIATYAGYGPVALAGHSMGGQIASLYAGLRPDRVSHLACLDSLNVPARPLDQVASRYRAWLDAQARAPEPKTYADVDDLAARVRRRYPELSESQVASLAQAWSQPRADGRIRLATDPNHFVPSPYGFRADEAMVLWRAVTAPVLCLDGGDSPAQHWLDADEQARRRACFANFEHQIMPGCGHMLHLEQPAAVAQRLAAFLDSAEQR